MLACSCWGQLGRAVLDDEWDNWDVAVSAAQSVTPVTTSEPVVSHPLHSTVNDQSHTIRTRYNMITYNTISLTCHKELIGGQLKLPHTNRNKNIKRIYNKEANVQQWVWSKSSSVKGSLRNKKFSSLGHQRPVFYYVNITARLANACTQCKLKYVFIDGPKFVYFCIYPTPTTSASMPYNSWLRQCSNCVMKSYMGHTIYIKRNHEFLELLQMLLQLWKHTYS